MSRPPGNIVPEIDRPIETVLLTNDDGVSSPFFAPMLKVLQESGQFKKIIFVAPAEEQSWIGSAVTRFRPVYAEPETIDGAEGFVVSGTPSDCTFLGLGNLFKERPDLVISGINLGTNCGRAFTASSGTVSAALAGYLGGCRSVAVSAKVPPIVFEQWGRHELKSLEQYQANWRNVAEIAAGIIINLIKVNIWKFADVPAIDLPWNATADTPVRVTTPGSTYYSQMFDAIGPGQYLHAFKGLNFGDPLGRTNNAPLLTPDLEVIQRDEISINPLSYGYFGSPHLGAGEDLIPALRALLEK